MIPHLLGLALPFFLISCPSRAAIPLGESGEDAIQYLEAGNPAARQPSRGVAPAPTWTRRAPLKLGVADRAPHPRREGLRDALSSSPAWGGRLGKLEPGLLVLLTLKAGRKNWGETVASLSGASWFEFDRSFKPVYLQEEKEFTVRGRIRREDLKKAMGLPSFAKISIEGKAALAESERSTLSIGIKLGTSPFMKGELERKLQSLKAISGFRSRAIQGVRKLGGGRNLVIVKGDIPSAKTGLLFSDPDVSAVGDSSRG